MYIYVCMHVICIYMSVCNVCICICICIYVMSYREVGGDVGGGVERKHRSVRMLENGTRVDNTAVDCLCERGYIHRQTDRQIYI